MMVSSCHAQPFRYSQVPGATYTLNIKSIWIDKNFSAKDKLAIDDAIIEWNYVLNGTIILKPISYNFDMEIDTIKDAAANHGLLIMKIDSSNSMVENDHTAAWVNVIGGYKLYVIKDRVGSRLKKIMLHELGHVLGAGHQPGNTLMFSIYDEKKFSCIDYATVQQVADYNHISISNLNYCRYLE